MFFWVNFCYWFKFWMDLLRFISFRYFDCGGLCIINVMFLFEEFMFVVLRLFGVIGLFLLINLICSLIFIDNVGFLLLMGVMIIGIECVVLYLLFVMFIMKEFWVFLFLLCWYIIEVDFLICVRENLGIGVIVFFCVFVIMLWFGGVIMKKINLFRGLLVLIVFRIVMLMIILLFLFILNFWMNICGILLFCGMILIFSK